MCVIFSIVILTRHLRMSSVMPVSLMPVYISEEKTISVPVDDVLPALQGAPKLLHPTLREGRSEMKLPVFKFLQSIVIVYMW